MNTKNHKIRVAIYKLLQLQIIFEMSMNYVIPRDIYFVKRFSFVCVHFANLSHLCIGLVPNREPGWFLQFDFSFHLNKPINLLLLLFWCAYAKAYVLLSSLPVVKYFSTNFTRRLETFREPECL